MRSLRFGAGLLVAIVLHVVAVRILGELSPAVDFFLVVVLFNAVDGNLVAGLLGGVAAGLTADALTGGLFGLHGFADTVIGYSSALASRRIVIQKAVGVMLLFSLAAAVQQALIVGLRLVLLPEAALPTVPGIAARIAVVGLLGYVGFSGRGYFTRGLERWRSSRRARLR
ncbi:MAG: rod shape-determining protein MreD [Acidobacteriota bacterium]|nr:rod shape-determining protein MreD [Acidobacteriota bacterium]